MSKKPQIPKLTKKLRGLWYDQVVCGKRERPKTRSAALNFPGSHEHSFALMNAKQSSDFFIEFCEQWMQCARNPSKNIVDDIREVTSYKIPQYLIGQPLAFSHLVLARGRVSGIKLWFVIGLTEDGRKICARLASLRHKNQEQLMKKLVQLGAEFLADEPGAREPLLTVTIC